jgi:hypothetical protein
MWCHFLLPSITQVSECWLDGLQIKGRSTYWNWGREKSGHHRTKESPLTTVWSLTSVAKTWRRFHGFEGGGIQTGHLTSLKLSVLAWSQHFCYWILCPHIDRLCGLLVRVSGYRPRGTGFDSRPYHIFWEVGSLERGPLSLVRTIEELLEWKSRGFGLENRD